MGYLDVHSHILCCVDDGSRSLAETGDMLKAAKVAGIVEIIATPHVYSLCADLAKIQESFRQVGAEYADRGIMLRQGYECNYRVLLEGEAEQLFSYCIEGTKTLLLEPPNRFLPESWENHILNLQKAGLDVVIAHPERCIAFQEDISQAERMREIGCELQLSAGSLFEGLLSKTRKCAMALLKAGMVGYIASDAHCARDYKEYEKAMRQYGLFIRTGRLLQAI